MSKPLFTERLSFGVTPEMDRFLEEMARTRTRKGKPTSKSDLLREAVRYYMDNQADLNGSRRQIAQSLDGKIAGLMDVMRQLHAQTRSLQAEVGKHNAVVEAMQAGLQPLLKWIAVRFSPPTK